MNGCHQSKVKVSSKNRESILAPLQKDTVGVEARTSFKTVVSLPSPVLNNSFASKDSRELFHSTHFHLNKNLKPDWSYKIGKGFSEDRPFLPLPIVHQGIFYSIDTEGKLIACSLEKQKVIWNGEIDTILGPSGLGLGDSKLFVSTGEGDIKSFEVLTGRLLWSINLGVPVRSSPVFYKGKVFVVSSTNETFCLDAKSGKTLWQHAGTLESALIIGGASPVIDAKGRVIIAYSSGEIFSLDSETGQSFWNEVITPAPQLYTSNSVNHIKASPVLAEGQGFFVSYGGSMVAVDLETGQIQWQKDLGGLHSPVVVGNWVFLLAQPSTIVCLDRLTGEIQWKSVLPQFGQEQMRLYWSGPLLADYSLILSNNQGELLFLNAQDGKTLKKLSFEGGASLPPFIVHKRLFILSDDGVLHGWH